MGSVVIIFFLPIFFFVMLFGSIGGAITGADKTKVELPYDEESGLVWECEEDAPWFSLVDVEIDGDKQIFTFKGESVSDCADELVDTEEVRFTAENSQTRLYYAFEDEEYIAFDYKVILYSPDEYGVIKYTPKAETYIESALWCSWNDENLYETKGPDGETEFTLVYFPENLTEESETSTFTTCLEYTYFGDNGFRREWERIVLEVELKDGEAKVISENHQYFDPYNYCWSDTKPEA